MYYICICLSDDLIVEVNADLDVDDDIDVNVDFDFDENTYSKEGDAATIVVRFVYFSLFGYSP